MTSFVFNPALVIPCTPPPYHPAPDYDEALKQPSLDQYNMAMWQRQTAVVAAEMTQNSAHFGSRNGSREGLVTQNMNDGNKNGNAYVLMGREGPIDVTTEHFTEMSDEKRTKTTTENGNERFVPTMVSDTCTQTSLPASSDEYASTSVSRDCSSSTVGSGVPQGLSGVFERYNPRGSGHGSHMDSNNDGGLPDFDDKNKHSVIPSCSSSHTVVATTVHNGGLSVERPDLLQGSHATDLSNDQRLGDMESRLKAGCLGDELDKIPKKRVSAGVSTSQKADNQRRNRFANILPYEDTRIMLRPHKNNPQGYINASNIQVPLNDTLVKYVATQGPMKETVDDFWQMIWETESRIIVMLTKSQEEGREKSVEYWPREGERQTKMKFGDFQVSLQSSTESQTHTTSCLQLKHTPSSQRRTVYHLQYLDWPAGGVPEFVDSFLGFLDEVSSVKRHLENESQRNMENGANRSRSQSRSSLFDISNQSTTGSWKRNTPGPSAGGRDRAMSDQTGTPLSLVGPATLGCLETPPVVVHCCSGAGRTGVYILTELMIYCLEHNHNMEVSQMLALLRQQRMHLVQTPAQYKFVYTCLVEYLKNSRLI